MYFIIQNSNMHRRSPFGMFITVEVVSFSCIITRDNSHMLVTLYIHRNVRITCRLQLPVAVSRNGIKTTNII